MDDVMSDGKVNGSAPHLNGVANHFIRKET